MKKRIEGERKRKERKEAYDMLHAEMGHQSEKKAVCLIKTVANDYRKINCTAC